MARETKIVLKFGVTFDDGSTSLKVWDEMTLHPAMRLSEFVDSVNAIAPAWWQKFRADPDIRTECGDDFDFERTDAPRCADLHFRFAKGTVGLEALTYDENGRLDPSWKDDLLSEVGNAHDVQKLAFETLEGVDVWIAFP